MSPPLEFQQAGISVRLCDDQGEVITSLNQLAVGGAPLPPDNFIYKWLRVATGTGQQGSVAMNLNSVTTGTVYEYEVPADKVFAFSRINFVIVDAAIAPAKFGGIAALPTGSTFQVIDADGSELLDFMDGVRIKTNPDFAGMAGADVMINISGGQDDQLPIRFSIFKAGRMMKLAAGQKIRWTNWDNLTGLTKFQTMVQGIIKDA